MCTDGMYNNIASGSHGNQGGSHGNDKRDDLRRTMYVHARRANNEELARRVRDDSMYENVPIGSFHSNNLNSNKHDNRDRNMGPVYGMEDTRPEIWNHVPGIKPQ